MCFYCILLSFTAVHMYDLPLGIYQNYLQSAMLWWFCSNYGSSPSKN